MDHPRSCPHRTRLACPSPIRHRFPFARRFLAGPRRFRRVARTLEFLPPRGPRHRNLALRRRCCGSVRKPHPCFSLDYRSPVVISLADIALCRDGTILGLPRFRPLRLFRHRPVRLAGRPLDSGLSGRPGPCECAWEIRSRQLRISLRRRPQPRRLEGPRVPFIHRVPHRRNGLHSPAGLFASCPGILRVCCRLVLRHPGHSNRFLGVSRAHRGHGNRSARHDRLLGRRRNAVRGVLSPSARRRSKTRPRAARCCFKPVYPGCDLQGIHRRFCRFGLVPQFLADLVRPEVPRQPRA